MGRNARHKATLTPFQGIALDPAGDRGVVDREASLRHDLFQIAITERGAQVPTDTQEHDLGFKVAPFGRVLLVHEGHFSAAS